MGVVTEDRTSESRYHRDQPASSLTSLRTGAPTPVFIKVSLVHRMASELEAR